MNNHKLADRRVPVVELCVAAHPLPPPSCVSQLTLQLPVG